MNSLLSQKNQRNGYWYLCRYPNTYADLFVDTSVSSSVGDMLATDTDGYSTPHGCLGYCAKGNRGTPNVFNLNSSHFYANQM